MRVYFKKQKVNSNEQSPAAVQNQIFKSKYLKNSIRVTSTFWIFARCFAIYLSINVCLIEISNLIVFFLENSIECLHSYNQFCFLCVTLF